MFKDALFIFLTSLAGGLLPLTVRWTERLMHAILGLSTGVFLGAVFLHLLPEVAALDHHASNGGGHDHGDLTVWMFVLVGVLGVYLVEALALRKQEHADDLHRHRAVSFAALLGLSIHSLTNGMGLAAAAKIGLAFPVFLSLICHKGAEAFSLTTVFHLAKFGRRHLVIQAVLFALICPLGILIGEILTESLSDHGLAIMTALAAGTFLFVCLCELLPEVFHHRQDMLLKIGLLVAGIFVMALIHELEPG